MKAGEKVNYEERKENKELRFQNLEIRMDDDTQEMILEGYPCVFNQETLIGSEEWGWIEVIDRNAFNGCDLKDCCLKYNHNDTKGVLARVKNGSLELSFDDYGMKMRAKLIDTTDNVDIYKCVKAGLLDKMSFAFTVAEEEFDYSRTPVLRRITKIDKLWDCAVVDVPAYSQTSVYARSRELVEAKISENRPSMELDEASLENDEKRANQLALEKLKFEILHRKENK